MPAPVIDPTPSIRWRLRDRVTPFSIILWGSLGFTLASALFLFHRNFQTLPDRAAFFLWVFLNGAQAGLISALVVPLTSWLLPCKAAFVNHWARVVVKGAVVLFLMIALGTGAARRLVPQ